MELRWVERQEVDPTYAGVCTGLDQITRMIKVLQIGIEREGWVNDAGTPVLDWKDVPVNQE